MAKQRAVNQAMLTANLGKLPLRVYFMQGGTLCCIARGEMGYYVTTPSTLTVAELNSMFNATPAHVSAMRMGSMFGYDCPAANPEAYGLNGEVLMVETKGE